MDVAESATYDAVELLDAYAAGELTALQALQSVTERIARRNPEINAFAAMNPAALTAARESSLRWHEGQARVLEGVPVTVSDLIDVAGLPTRRGSKTTESAVARRDAPIVAVLRAAGAVIIGKTNSSEFGWKYQGDNPLSGIIRNPWNTLHTAGGASGGAAAAAASFFAPLHIADAAVCVAASWNGVVGLKVGSMSENQGIITRSVADIGLLSAVLKGHIPTRCQNETVQGIKIGILRVPGIQASTSAAGWKALDQAKDILQAQGAIFSEITLEAEGIEGAFLSLWKAKCLKDVQDIASPQRALLDPDLLKFTEQLKADRLVDEDKIQKICSHAGQIIDDLTVDIILCPAVAQAAPLVTIETPNPVRAMIEDWAPWTMLFTLAGQPALTLPLGVDAQGLPVSVQLAGKTRDDELLVRVAKALEYGLG